MLVASGQNIAFVLVAAHPLLKRLPSGGRVALTVCIVVCFTWVTRAEPSILRAGAMACIAVASRNWGWNIDPLGTASWAILALISVDPLIVWSFGFQLSCAATLGILCISPALITLGERVMPAALSHRWARALVTLVAVSAAANVSTMPLIAARFGFVASTGLIANLVAVPLAGLMSTFGAVALPGASLVGGPLRWLTVTPMAWGARLMEQIVTICNDIGAPALGLAGALALATLCIATVVRARRVAVVVLTAISATLGLVEWSTTKDAHVVISGVELWTSGSTSVMAIRAGARPATVFQVLERSARPRIDVVVVLGTGSNVASSVFALRQVASPGVVAELVPRTVRDAVPLTEGELAIDTRPWCVSETSHVWSVTPGHCASAG